MELLVNIDVADLDMAIRFYNVPLACSLVVDCLRVCR